MWWADAALGEKGLMGDDLFVFLCLCALECSQLFSVWLVCSGGWWGGAFLRLVFLSHKDANP